MGTSFSASVASPVADNILYAVCNASPCSPFSDFSSSFVNSNNYDLTFLYNSDYEHGVPHPPQNFAVGFSGFPQLLQDEDVGRVSAGFGLGL